MKADERGLWISKAEIAALLAFTGPAEEPPLHAVRLTVKKRSIWCYASDGRRAIEVNAASDTDAVEGEWIVTPPFLDSLKKILGTDHLAVIELTPTGITRADIVSVDDETGNVEDIASVTWPENAASTQVTIDALREVIKIPRTERSVKCITLPGSQLAALAVVVKATGREAIDVYPPKLVTEPVVFRAEGAATTWLGVIMPCRDEDDADETGEAKREKRANKHSRARGSTPELPNL